MASAEQQAHDEEDTLLARPAAPGQYDSAASVTSIALFHACPRKYYLGRYLGLSPGMAAPWQVVPEQDSEVAFETTGGADAAAIGLETHAILAGNPPPNPDPEAVTLARRFLESGLGRRVERAGRVEREFDFMFSLHDVVLSGKIDLWFEEGGELVLVDYKTDRDLEGLASYTVQLRLYALAMERFRRIPDHAVLHFLRLDREVPVSLSKRDLAEAAEVALDFRDAQAGVKFPMKINRQCLRCPFYGTACPADRSTAAIP